METAIIYARFSSHGQNEQSIEAQVRICKEFAESKGYKVINVYSDKARTGTNDLRPGFQRMIADAESNSFKYIIVYMFDRFARNRRDSIMYKEMLKEKYGIRVLSALEPIAEDEGGEFYEMFLDWNAEKYSKRLSKRVRDGLDTSVANGTFCGGTLIYGYKIELEPIAGKSNKFIKRVVINEEEAFIVRYYFEQYANGVKKKDIAKALNEQGYRFKGKPFTHKTFDRYLLNEKYTGEFTFGGRKSTNMYPAIVDKATFMAVQKRLNANRYFAGGVATARVPYLLTGKLYCYECGTAMVSDAGTSKSGAKYSYYACKTAKQHKCSKMRESKDFLEEYVVSCVVDFLSDNKKAEIAVDDVLNYYNKRTHIDNLKSITAKIAGVHKEVDELAMSFVKAQSVLLQNSIETKMKEYEILLNDLERQKAQLELERGFVITREHLLAFIADLITGDIEDKEYQKLIIDHLVNRVYVGDDFTITYLNLRGGKGNEPATIEDTKNALTEEPTTTSTEIHDNNTNNVQTQLPPARQSPSHSKMRWLYFCLNGCIGIVVPTKKYEIPVPTNHLNQPRDEFGNFIKTDNKQ